jgi:hypothetical protein
MTTGKNASSPSWPPTTSLHWLGPTIGSTNSHPTPTNTKAIANSAKHPTPPTTKPAPNNAP